MPFRVFISYSEEDSDKKDILNKALKRQKDIFTPIVVASKGSPARLLADKVKTNIDESDIFIPILSQNSISNQWVNQEIGYSFSKKQLMILPIVEVSLTSVLKGFIHNQMDLSFKFNEKNITDFKICCTKLIKYIKDEVKPKLIEKNVSISPRINAARMAEILEIMYPAYGLYHTKLLHPKAPNLLIENHSHKENGYFHWLNQNQETNYSFKYWNKRNPENYIEIAVNHLAKTLNIRCQLDSNRSHIFVKEFIERLNKQ